MRHPFSHKLRAVCAVAAPLAAIASAGTLAGCVPPPRPLYPPPPPVYPVAPPESVAPVYVPARPYVEPGIPVRVRHWVPAHYDAYGRWIPGHWVYN
jgi:hypothetical protein